MATTSPTQRGKAFLGAVSQRVGRRLPRNVQRAINTARGIDTPRLVDHLGGTRPMVLAPHPDDELIGAGGALLGYLHRGVQPLVVHLTSGERTVGLAHLPVDERGPTREREALTAAGVLGVDEPHVRFLRLPDGGLDGRDDDQIAALSKAIVPADPDLVLAPWPVDSHRDHTATTELLSIVAHSLAPTVRIALYEVWTPLAPTHLIDITADIDTKVAALAEYRSALDSVDYRHTARGLAAYRSAQGMHGAGYAEAFTIVSPTALDEMLTRLRA